MIERYYYNPDNPDVAVTTGGTFGGPADPQDNGRFAFGGGSTLPDGTLNPEPYAAFPEEMYRSGKVIPGGKYTVENPYNGRTAEVIARDIGPSAKHRGIDVAPHVMDALGSDTDHPLVVHFGNQTQDNTELAQAMNPSGLGQAEIPQPSGNLAAVDPYSNLSNELSAIPPSRLMASNDPSTTAEMLSDVSAPTETGTEDAMLLGENQKQEEAYTPPPPPHGAKIVDQAPDGSWAKWSNGVIYNKVDDSITYKDQATGRTFVARPGQKPVPVPLPKIYHNAEDGKTYDMSDPNSPKEIKFPSATEVPEGATGEAALVGVPESEKAIIKKLTAYQIPMPSGFAMRSPYWQRVIARASLYDPTFDASQYPIRMGVRKSFTSGQDARNIGSLNTAVNHLEELKHASEQLNNTHFPIVNQLVNLGREATGDPRVVRFNTAAAAVQNELASVFKGTGATDQEINTWRKNLNSAQSPAQVQGAIDEAINLMGGRLNALQGKYVEGMGKPADFDILNPKSKEILNRLGRKDITEGYQFAPGEQTIPSATPSPTPTPTTTSTASPADQAALIKAQQVLKVHPTNATALKTLEILKAKGIVP